MESVVVHLVWSPFLGGLTKLTSVTPLLQDLSANIGQQIP